MSPRQGGFVLGALAIGVTVILLPGSIRNLGALPALGTFIVAALVGAAGMWCLPKRRDPISPRTPAKMSAPTVLMMGAAGATASLVMPHLGDKVTLVFYGACAGFLLALSIRVMIVAPRRQH